MTSQPPRFGFEVPDQFPDEWSTRDLPTLRAVAHQFARDADLVMASTLAHSVEDEDRIEAALEALNGAYLECVRMEGSLAGAGELRALRLTERGRRAVGLWPSGEAADALVDALHQAEGLIDDAEEKTLLRRAAGAVGSVSRDVMVDVMAAVVARQSGIG